MGRAGGRDVAAGLQTARVAEPGAASASLGCSSPLPILHPCRVQLVSQQGGRSQAPITPRVPAAALRPCALLPAGDFSPSSCSLWEPAAEDCWLWECSPCPLLYLLHLTNLMTGGMRSISNMASLAGSGQSTQEAFLHTPIPAGCCCSLLPWASRRRLPCAGWDWRGWLSPSRLAAGWTCPFAGQLSAAPAAVGGRWVPRRFESVAGRVGEGRARADAAEQDVPSARSLGRCPSLLHHAQPTGRTWRGSPEHARWVALGGSQGVPWEQGAL